MTADIDVAIIGGGPAGSAAATTLARAGREVVLFDKAVFPREKCCGDGLTALALRELESLGLQPSGIGSWKPLDRFVVRSPSGREHFYSLPSGEGHHAVVARRAELDEALLALAEQSGALVHQADALEKAVASDDGVALTLSASGRVTARHVVGADGMWSPLRRELGLSTEGYRGEWHAFRQYFHDVGRRAANELVIWFEPDLLPGYAWSFPLADRTANVGFGIRRGGRVPVGDMKAVWADLLDRPHVKEFLGVDAAPEGPHKAWPIPARVGRTPLVGPHTMFVGDAAAVTDPMTGEGIGQALLTGRLAAESIIDGDSPPATYEKRARAELVADDRMARLLIPMLSHQRVADSVLRITATTAWTRRNFARWMFEDYPRAIIATPRRWHRGMFTGPGAYPDARSR